MDDAAWGADTCRDVDRSLPPKAVDGRGVEPVRILLRFAPADPVVADRKGDGRVVGAGSRAPRRRARVRLVGQHFGKPRSTRDLGSLGLGAGEEGSW